MKTSFKNSFVHCIDKLDIMKKLLLLLLLVPMVSFGQQTTTESDFRNGYITGFKKGYCIDERYCNPPFSIKVPLWGKMGFNTYSDGYSKGVIAGQAKKESANKESSSSQGAYENAGSANTSSGGAYENPTPVIQPIPGVAVGNAMTKAGGQIAGELMAKGFAVLKEQKKNEGTFYLGNGVYRITRVGGSGFVSLKKLNKRCDEEMESIAKKLDVRFELIDTERKKQKMAKSFPQVSNTYLLTYTNGKIYKNEEDENRLEEIEAKNKASLKIKKQEAVNSSMEELKRYKDLLDMGVITQEEFDKKAAELKKVILGN